jgi:hypothetical protein
MFSPLQRSSCPRPRKGINAEVLIDGFSPGAPKEIFDLGPGHHLVAKYLLERCRGFNRITKTAQFPRSEFITIASNPATTDQFRLAFGLTLIMDAIECSGRMGFKLILESRSVGRFVQPAESASCIRFLEAIEGVDELEIRFRYRDTKSNCIVKGNFRI